MNSVIMDGATIGEESIVAAMSFVKAGFTGEARQMLVGSPARVLREVTDQELHWKRLDGVDRKVCEKRRTSLEDTGRFMCVCSNLTRITQYP